jgi:DNA repair protein RadC
MILRELKILYAPGRRVDYDNRRALTSPRDAAAILIPLLQDQPGEVIGVLLLDARSRLLAWHECARGQLAGVNVEPREVFRAALLANAHSLILAHCHPSGDPTPSPDDVALTARMQAAGVLLGIEVADHIVIGHERYWSFRDAGQL